MDALKAGPPRLAILQQGRVEELVEALAKLRAENEALEADQSARDELQQRMGNLAREALRIAETLLSSKRANPGNAGFVNPAIGQIWRGMHPHYGFGHFEEAEITEITERRILLRWLDGSGTHQTTPDLFGPSQTWSFVRTSTQET
ncbi:hypothetical protein [Sphingomonas adhaesiva]|uniref:hypothetical protein n=1 Tax=Sphingomonas adhaesiva TaxID=28212 RepID=UPI002FF5F01E